jgi:hypothetical protein
MPQTQAALTAQGAALTALGSSSANNIAAATVVKAGRGRIARVSVTTGGAAGAIHDAATTGAVAAGNLIAVIPDVVGVYEIDFPCLNGIVVSPGAAQVVSVSYT